MNRYYLVFVIFWVASGCKATKSPAEPTDPELIRKHFVPKPKPANPKYGKVLSSCIFFISDPEDSKMVPVGLLKSNSFVILHQSDGNWADIQLSSGHMGSVFARNVRDLQTGETPLEDAGQIGLEPLPKIETGLNQKPPTPLPQ